MRIGVVVEGDLRAAFRESIDAMSVVVSTSVNKASIGLRDELRAQVRAVFRNDAGGLQKAWQARLYPSRRPSMGAAGWVFSKSRRIHAAFAQPRTIVARGRRWQVLPMEGAIRRGWDREGGEGGFGKPRKWSAFDRVLKLKGVVWMPRPNGNVIVGLRAGQGRAVERLFLLTKSVRLKGGLDLDGPAQRWLDRLYADLAKSIGG